jgi:hypothetical protein
MGDKYNQQEYNPKGDESPEGAQRMGTPIQTGMRERKRVDKKDSLEKVVCGLHLGE